MAWRTGTTKWKTKVNKSKSERKAKSGSKRKTVAPMETATIKETISLNDIQANQAYSAETNLTLFDRALDIADNYQEYRIVSLEYKYTPIYDTYAYDGAGTPGKSLPYLYAKTLNVPAPATFGLDFLKTMGAKPRRLDDKTVVVKYKPYIQQSGVANVLSTGGIRSPKSPWLSTHINNGTGVSLMDTTLHGYHAFWVETSLVSPTMPVICQVELVATFEFRKPWDLKASVPPAGTAPAIVLSRKTRSV